MRALFAILAVCGYAFATLGVGAPFIAKAFGPESERDCENPHMFRDTSKRSLSTEPSPFAKLTAKKDIA
jgi:hypothetical protein